MAATKARELTVSLNVDVSEALTGLKAVQREARKAAQALRELEATQSSHTIFRKDELVWWKNETHQVITAGNDFAVLGKATLMSDFDDRLFWRTNYDNLIAITNDLSLFDTIKENVKRVEETDVIPVVKADE